MIIKEYNVIVDGTLTAEALASDTALSFWGGVNVATGEILDVHHDLCGQNTKGKALCIPFDRGSCSGSGILFEMIRQGTNPAAMLCVEAEAVLSLASVIGNKIYGRTMPIRTVSQDILRQIKTGDLVTFTEDTITVESGK